MNGLEQLLPFVLIVAAFWFLLIRPQRKRQQQLASTQRGVEVGDEVMLGSGIYGTVSSVEEETLHLEVSPGTSVKVARAAVVRVVTEHPEDPAAEDGPGSELDPTNEQPGSQY